MSREHARAIWQAGVEAVRPEPLVEAALRDAHVAGAAARILVVGAGKAGPGMAMGVERALADRLYLVDGLVNVPEGMSAPLRRIRLHPARPQGVNEPTTAGVAGTEEMLRLLEGAGPDDLALCLLSGGGSALLPAPIEGITLSDKLSITKELTRCGATIDEMNCVRKHLSRVKGGRMAEAFHGHRMLSLIISDVIGDPLDVIASGPTAPDPTTFHDALVVLDKYRLRTRVPANVLSHLERGAAGEIGETPKHVSPRVENRIIGSNRLALAAAEQRARELGYRVINLGSAVAGETSTAAKDQAELAMTVRRECTSGMPPVCILSGGETTVTLGDRPGKGGRNQEFVLAVTLRVGVPGMHGMTVLSGGTDGEDGPTDAAGAVADETIWDALRANHLDAAAALARHDAYPLFQRANSLIKSGLTGTNVMDLHVILVRGV